jgi:hypothetical protein
VCAILGLERRVLAVGLRVVQDVGQQLTDATEKVSSRLKYARTAGRGDGLEKPTVDV